MKSKGTLVRSLQLEIVAGRSRPRPHLRSSFDDVITAMVGDIAMMETPMLMFPKRLTVVEVFNRKWVWGVEDKRLSG